MRMRYISSNIGLSLLVCLFTTHLVIATPNADEALSKIVVINQVTHQPLENTSVFVNQHLKRSYRDGVIHIPRSNKPVTIDVIYWDGDLRRIETFHQVSVHDQVTLPVPYAGALRREAVFSIALPFGKLDKAAKAVIILPQLAYDTGGLNFGNFGNIRLYQDQLQHDGRFSLMMVALDESLIPFKYGYFLDKDPSQLENSINHFAPPFATPLEHRRQLVAWRKAADAIDPSDKNTQCDFKDPPLTKCGLIPPRGGVFSWINIWRKGQSFHTPGAFLPSRTQGENPLLLLPDSKIELVGHDDPLGFYPANFARHRFLKLPAAPSEEIEIQMPNIMIGSQQGAGKQAITFDVKNQSIAFDIHTANKDSVDISNMDYGRIQLAWNDKNNDLRTIWNHTFEPSAGKNQIKLSKLPAVFTAWQPNSDSQFSNIQVWLYGSNSVNSYAEALSSILSGKDPLHSGNNAFQVSRWH